MPSRVVERTLIGKSDVIPSRLARHPALRATLHAQLGMPSNQGENRIMPGFPSPVSSSSVGPLKISEWINGELQVTQTNNHLLLLVMFGTTDYKA